MQWCVALLDMEAVSVQIFYEIHRMTSCSWFRDSHSATEQNRHSVHYAVSLRLDYFMALQQEEKRSNICSDSYSIDAALCKTVKHTSIAMRIDHVINVLPVPSTMLPVAS